MNPEERKILIDFRRGVFLLLIVQGVFMLGGLIIERLLKAPVTGVPSMFGMTLVLFIAALMSEERSPYVLLGSFSIAFLSPVSLFLVTHFKAFPFEERLVYYSLGYLSALIIAVWIYFGVRILKGRM